MRGALATIPTAAALVALYLLADIIGRILEVTL